MKNIILLLLLTFLLCSCTKEASNHGGSTFDTGGGSNLASITNTWWHLDSVVHPSVTINKDRIYEFGNSNCKITNYEFNPSGSISNHWFLYNSSSKKLRLQGTAVNDTNDYTVNILTFNKLVFVNDASPFETYHLSN
ncbi:MAG: hypothetical protein OQJ96_08065 [Flavobacteriales bacterium]|jgi:hypothetical protein|nr:hypothetical protein [Flavobacteriales bacterium]MCW8912290.1 hypothetical protein [Flavobacteriales bacterium]MCW8937471.1 hypothetical protein [Flavobacteriales bacterium]MCW8940656.1 hypothetical protein [Flavobacteriales bacterium]MCW8968354.1 hypothetical protein [Flavobacteriales bacterium]